MKIWLKATSALTVCALGFSAFGGQKHPHVVPESGFLSPERYTNAFLGFSVPLPQDLPYQVLIPSPPKKREPLLNLEFDNGRVGFKILAAPTASDHDVPSFPGDNRPGQSPLDRCDSNRTISPFCIYIGGTAFSRQVIRGKVGAETLSVVTYEARIYNYSLTFLIQALDENVARKLERCVEGTTFFEPGKAQQVAGPDSRPFNPLLERPPHH